MRTHPLVTLLVAALFAGASGAAECPGSLLGELTEGPVRALALHAGHLYIGSGATLLTYSLADQNPVRTSAVQLHGLVLDITPSAGHLYVAAADAGVEILDLADPGQPVPLSRIPATSYVGSVAVSGPRAYLLDSGTGLRIFDVTSPSAPAQLGAWVTSLYLNEVEVSGSYAFVTAQAPEYIRGLVIVDVSDPGAPVQISYSGTGSGSGPRDLAVAGSLVYVAASGPGLVVLDVSNPQNPVLVGQYSQHAVSDVALVGDRAFVVGWTGFRVLDVADPSNPVEIGTLPAAVGERVAATAGLAAAGAWASVGVELLDVSVPATPVSIWSFDAPGPVAGVAISGASVFLASGNEGLRVVDASDPSNPAEIGALAFPLPSYLSDILVDAGRAYVADEGLRIIDVSNPADPVPISALTLGGNADRLAKAGTRVYVFTSDAGLRIVDVANPAAPVEVGFYVPAGYPRDLAANGMIVVLGTSLDVRVLDATDPAAPVLRSTIDVPGTTSVAMNGSLLAITSVFSSSPHLDLVDLSDPSFPLTLDSRAFGGSSSPGARLSMTSTRLAIRDPNEGLFLFDIVDPSRPFEVGRYDSPGYGSDVAMAGDLVVSGNGDAGISLLSASGMSACWLFSDGFETGDTSYWTVTEP
ncbi:MAG: PQQ-binding-like beta-propeller repeat protein [Thermoanaerobaculia bacterium]|nr:MAG: PQQ-binding-like beta-propeller repeat protein [Thermoanaerobaculia bacterium]